METMKYFPFDKLEEMKYTLLNQTVDVLYLCLVAFMVVVLLKLFSDNGK